MYPDRIAMDFTTGHIYFTAVASELYESYVGILHPQKSVHKKLITQLGTPRAIAVHPSAGYVKFVFGSVDLVIHPHPTPPPIL